MKKLIFVTGGVCSSLGKGVAASSIGALMEARGLAVRMVKIDPYLNVDAGTMSPYQHGEVYVTDDGAETDLDLGNYGRYTHSPLSKVNSITTGQVYQAVINKEREGRYLGRTVQVIPHVTDEIKNRVLAPGKDPEVDITIVEVGGTVGDMESIPFLEAARQIIHEMGRQNALSVHVTLVLAVSGRRAQDQADAARRKELQEVGIQPDALVIRAAEPIDEGMRRKIAGFTNVEFEGVISGHDARTTIYELLSLYHSQGFDTFLLKKMGIESRHADLREWTEVVRKYREPRRRVRVGRGRQVHGPQRLVQVRVGGPLPRRHRERRGRRRDQDRFGKAGGRWRRHGAGVRRHRRRLGARRLRPARLGGHGPSREMGAREQDPLLRDLPGDADDGHRVGARRPPVGGCRLDGVQPGHPARCHQPPRGPGDIKSYGGTQRLGKSESSLKAGTLIRKIYGTDSIWERHRHRYEVSNAFKADLERTGLLITALTPDGSLVEAVEWADHPWGLGVQCHPEFKSRPVQPAPLFKSFIGACIANAKA